MRKLIDDNRLIELHNEGKTQVEIAKEFGVSNVAVHKRLKKLLAGNVLDKYDLTPQQRAFVLEKAQGKTNVIAAMNSYDVTSRASAKVVGKDLMKKPAIIEAIGELMQQQGLTHEYRIRRLKNHVDSKDASASLKALDMAFRLDGSYPSEKKINLNLNVPLGFVDLTPYLLPNKNKREVEQGVIDAEVIEINQIEK